MAEAARAEGLQPKHHYDGHRTVCTCDDKKQASMISGHTWNILNNRSDHEVYLRNARSSDHYIDERGRTTSSWFEQKRRIDLDGDGIIDCVDSSNVAEVMRCPPTAGKEAAQSRTRQARQLCQASAPGDFSRYVVARGASSVAPPTPGRGGDLERRVPFQERRRDPHARATPRVAERLQWTPRRGEPCAERRPPQEHDMYRTVDQMACESHIDAEDPNFAEMLHSQRRGSSLGAWGATAVSGACTVRSRVNRDLPPKPGHEMTKHSSQRLEATGTRQISMWKHEQRDTLKRGDPFYAMPVQHAGGSSVKYDIISGEKKQFWY